MPETPVKLRLGWQRVPYLGGAAIRHRYAYAIMTIIDGGNYRLEKVVAGPDGASSAGVSVGANMTPHAARYFYRKKSYWEWPITQDLPADTASWDRLIQHAVQRHVVQTEGINRASAAAAAR